MRNAHVFMAAFFKKHFDGGTCKKMSKNASRGIFREYCFPVSLFLYCLTFNWKGWAFTHMYILHLFKKSEALPRISIVLMDSKKFTKEFREMTMSTFHNKMMYHTDSSRLGSSQTCEITHQNRTNQRSHSPLNSWFKPKPSIKAIILYTNRRDRRDYADTIYSEVHWFCIAILISRLHQNQRLN